MGCPVDTSGSRAQPKEITKIEVNCQQKQKPSRLPCSRCVQVSTQRLSDMNKVRVEGSLNYDDGSSSDSEPEPDEPDRPPSPPLVLHLDGGDDEEVEYFGDKKITLPIAQNVAKPPEPASTVTVHEGNTASESRLASILGGNIDAFESGGNSAFSEPASKPPAADAPPAGNYP